MTAPRIKVPTVQDFMRDPVGSTIQLANLPTQINIATTTAAADRLPNAFGEKSFSQQKADAQDAANLAAENAEETARADAVNNALSDKTLDATTRQELLKLYQSGGNSAAIAEVLGQARQGKGIYGIRKLNENQQNVAKMMPGRSQVLSLGTGSKI